ncbi:MAG: alkaline phosphatase [Proteiniphilum sp.]
MQQNETIPILTNYLLDGKLTLLAGGGMNVFNDRKDAKDFLSELEKQYRVTNDHTPIMLPVFAYGPGSRNFSGVYNNTDIFHKMKELLGL